MKITTVRKQEGSVMMSTRHIDIVQMIFCSRDEREVITAAINTREITKDMSRVKSSNIWSRKIDVRKYGDKFGDVYIQFKGRHGGPDDIYVYYDVPVVVYRRWMSAPSAGHYFWEYIRNNYKYRKLTGDKRGKLRNAVN